MIDKEIRRLGRVLWPLKVLKMPLTEMPPRNSRFGSPLELSRVHWVRPGCAACAEARSAGKHFVNAA
jgi:hypothetical protein